jgi:hypothetical protein
MFKNRISFIISALLTMSLLAGIPVFTCDNSRLNVAALLGSSIGAVLVVYALAIAFALLGTIFQYFSLFADKGTVLRPAMSRNRAWILIGGVAVCLLVLKWSTIHFCF